MKKGSKQLLQIGDGWAFIFCFNFKTGIIFKYCGSMLHSNDGKHAKCPVTKKLCIWYLKWCCELQYAERREKTFVYYIANRLCIWLNSWVMLRKEAWEWPTRPEFKKNKKKQEVKPRVFINVHELKAVKLVLSLETRWTWNYFTPLYLIGHVLNLHNTIIVLLEKCFNSVCALNETLILEKIKSWGNAVFKLLMVFVFTDKMQMSPIVLD